MISDIDHDDLDEIIVVNYSKNSYNTIVYIWEYSQEEKTMISHVLFKRKDTSMPELIVKNDTIYLQYSYKWKLKQRKLKYQPEKHDIYSMDPCKENLATKLYKTPKEARLSKFQFLETPVNNEPYVEMIPRKTTGFPLVTMPDEYKAKKDFLTKEELEYIQERKAP